MKDSLEVKKSWSQRVLDFLKLGEESHLNMMESQMRKFYKEEIRKVKAAMEANERRVNDLLEEGSERLEELKVAEDDAFLNLDLDKIKSFDSRKSYAIDLDNQFNIAIRARKDYEEYLDNVQKDFEMSQKSLQEKLEFLEYKKAKL